MLAERPRIEQAVQAVFAREGFTVRRMPEEHAGGKWSLRYQSAAGQGGNLEVDLNFMYTILRSDKGTLVSVPNNLFAQRFIRRSVVRGQPERTLAEQLTADEPLEE